MKGSVNVNSFNQVYGALKRWLLSFVSNSAIDKGLTGNGTTNDATALNAYITSVGTTPTDLYFPPGTYKLSSSITVPSNVRLVFANGAMLSPDSGMTIMISGKIEAGLYQIFTGAGTNTIYIRNNTSGYYTGTTEVYPQWFGATGDGIIRTIASVDTSITLAQVQALDASATLSNSIDWYAIQLCVKNFSNTKIVGDFITDRPIVFSGNDKYLIGSQGISYIRNRGVGLSAIILGVVGSTYIDRVSMVDLQVFGVKAPLISASGHGLEIRNAVNIVAERCRFMQNGGNGLYSHANHNMWIAKFLNCQFSENKLNGVNIRHYYAYQKNNISFMGCRNHSNGYNDAGDNLYAAGTRTTTSGHGYDISGMAINISGGCDCEGNSGAGIYLNGQYSESLLNGINITGNYFEPNLLADIYIDNTVQSLKNSVIQGNFKGAEELTTDLYGHLYIVDGTKVIGSTLSDSVYNIKDSFIKDIVRPTTLLTGGDMANKNSIFKTNSNHYDVIFGDGIILNSATPNLSSSFYCDGIFDMPKISYNSNKRYRWEIDYYWNKVASTAIIFGWVAMDYDSLYLIKSTLPSNRITNLDTLSQAVNIGDTVLHFDDLTGWDAPSGTPYRMCFYDYVLSNGSAVGTDFTRKYLAYTSVSAIDVVAKTVTLTAPITFAVALGVSVSLNKADPSNDSMISTYMYDSSAGGAITNYQSNIGVLESGKHIKYLYPYALINSPGASDYCMIRRIRIKEVENGEYQVSATWNPGSLSDGAGETSASIPVTGAALGDFVVCSAPYDLQGICCNPYVDAANSVKIRLQNETGSTIDLASGSWKVRVIKS